MNHNQQASTLQVGNSLDDFNLQLWGLQDDQRSIDYFSTQLNLNHQESLPDNTIKASFFIKQQYAQTEPSPYDFSFLIEFEGFLRDQESTNQAQVNFIQGKDQAIPDQQILNEVFRTQGINYREKFHFKKQFIEKKVLSIQIELDVIKDTKSSSIQRNARNEQGKSISNNISSKIHTMIKKHFLKNQFDDFMKNNGMKGNSQLVIICFYLFLLEQNVEISLAKSYLDNLHIYLKKRKTQVDKKINKQTGEYFKITCQLQLIQYLISLNFERQKLNLDALCQISEPLYKGRQKGTNMKEFGKFEKIYEDVLKREDIHVLQTPKQSYDIYL